LVQIIDVCFLLKEADPMRWEAVDHAQVGIKLVILLAVLILGYRAKRKQSLSKNTWLPMVLLTVIAVVW
jgi:hypothetical protein